MAAACAPSLREQISSALPHACELGALSDRPGTQVIALRIFDRTGCVPQKA
jgi:hypothetical protein